VEAGDPNAVEEDPDDEVVVAPGPCGGVSVVETVSGDRYGDWDKLGSMSQEELLAELRCLSCCCYCCIQLVREFGMIGVFWCHFLIRHLDERIDVDGSMTADLTLLDM